MTSGANSAASPRSTKSAGTASPGWRRSRSASVALTTLELDAAEEGGRRLAGLVLARVELDQPLDGLRDAARRNLRRDAAERGAVLERPAADHHEVLRHGARAEPPHAALEPDRRDVMLAAAVRAAADLDARAVGRGDEIGTRAQVIFEQPAEAARLRHRQPARLRARAAGDVGDRCPPRPARDPPRPAADTAGRTSHAFTQRNTRS